MLQITLRNIMRIFITPAAPQHFCCFKDSKEIQHVHSKGTQSWILIGRTNAEAETPILQPPDAKNWLIWKDLDAGKDWRWKEKGMTEDEMVGWHHQLNGHELVNLGSWWWTGRPGVLQSMGGKDSDTTAGLNWTELNWCKVAQGPGWLECFHSVGLALFARLSSS